MALFRPPGMRHTPTVLAIARATGYTTIDWTTGAKDFTGFNELGMQVEPRPAEIVERVMRNVSAGSIIVLHDTPATAKAMLSLLKRLRIEGYQVVTVSQMLASLPKPIWVASNPVTPSRIAKRSKQLRYVKQPRTKVAPRKLQQRLDSTALEYLELASPEAA
jgi:hypothetical protein